MIKSSNTCLVDNCAECLNPVVPTCQKCNNKYLLVNLFATEKGVYYNDCYNVMTIGSVCLAILTYLVVNIWLCFRCHSLGMDKSKNISKLMAKQNEK